MLQTVVLQDSVCCKVWFHRIPVKTKKEKILKVSRMIQKKNAIMQVRRNSEPHSSLSTTEAKSNKFPELKVTF